MRRRRQKNPLLMRIILVSVGIHIIALPIMAHFGAFKKIQREFLQTQMVVLPPPKVDKEKVVTKTRRAPQHMGRAHVAAGHSRSGAHAGPPHPRVAVAQNSGGAQDDAGPTIDEGTGKAGQLPPAPVKTSGGNGSDSAGSASAAPTTQRAAVPAPAVKAQSTATSSAPAPAPLASSAPVKSEAVFAEAVPVAMPQPIIPDDLRADAMDKTCVAEFVVARDGTPTDIRITQSTGSDELDRLALESARRWRFRPATRDGQPIESRVRLHVEFQVS